MSVSKPLLSPEGWPGYSEASCHEAGHTWSPSCIYTSLEFGAFVFYEGFKIYLPLFLCSELVRGRWRPRQLLQALPQAVRSALFLSCNGTGAIACICLLRRLIGRFYHFSAIFLPSCVGTGCALLIERKSRRALLAGYVATIAIELTYAMLKYRKYIRPLPYGEVALFSLATSILFHNLGSGSSLSSDDIVSQFIRRLLLPPVPAFIARSLQSTVLDNRLSRILVVGVWSFLLGYLIHCLVGVVNCGTKILTKTEQLKECLCDMDAIKLGAFLSTLAAGYKLVSTLLYYLPVSSTVRKLLAGLVAGFSLAFYRSSSLALYVAWKALEVLYGKGVKRGWLRYIPNAEVLIYAVSTGWLFHGLFFESHNMRLAYWNFLRRVSRGRILQFNYKELDKFGTRSSSRLTEWRSHKRNKVKHLYVQGLREEQTTPSATVGHGDQGNQ